MAKETAIKEKNLPLEPAGQAEEPCVQRNSAAKLKDGWLSTVGMFSDDADMLEISEEIRKVRDKQRPA